MASVQFVDTTLRDGQQSLWAMNMRTSDMVPALPYLDAAGFEQIELMAPGAAFKKHVRHLGTNPWDWVHAAVANTQHSQLRWHGRFEGSSLSGGIPPEVGLLMIKRVVDLGIRYTRIGDNWNRMGLLQAKMDALDGVGMTPVINIMYSVSARHTEEYFVDKAREAAALRPFRICFKDVGGLLTPERTRSLLRMMMHETGSIPWEFHGHCNNGLGPLNVLEAVGAGVEYVHTAVPPLANGNSQPSVYNVAGNLRASGHRVDVDLDVLRPVTDHFTEVATRRRLPVGVPHEYDERQYRHQVPGGMISNLEYQLRSVGHGGRLEETLEEAGRVRAEFGYPIMVTPLSQFVGSQAALNVIIGDRYKLVSDEVIHYALGRHGGDEAVTAMDVEVRAKILDRPRARELERYEEPQPTVRELRRRYGETISDEDLILRAIVGDDAVDAVGPPGQRKAASSDKPLLSLLRGLTERSSHTHVSVMSGDLSLSLRRQASAANE